MSGWGRGGQGRCERRIEVFVRIQNKIGGGGVRGGGSGGVVLGGQDGCYRLKFLGKFTQKKFREGVGLGGGGGLGWGVRVDVNEELKFL